MEGENQQVAVYEGGSGISLLPRDMQAEINAVIAMETAVTQIFQKCLVINKDFDRIPGTDKLALLKPGAERLCHLFKLTSGETRVMDKTEDWEKGIFSYTVGIPLIHRVGGELVAYTVSDRQTLLKKGTVTENQKTMQPKLP